MGDEVTIDPVVFWERMAKLYKSWAVRALGPCLQTLLPLTAAPAAPYCVLSVHSARVCARTA